MAVARQLRVISTKQAAGLEVRKEHCCGMTLIGKSIGIVGMGNIGTAVARMFSGAFGASVYACDPFASTEAWADIPHTRVNQWEDMLSHIDVLTIHVPLNAKSLRHCRNMRSCGQQGRLSAPHTSVQRQQRRRCSHL